ncbi:GNAT family N-acetyltransferase [Marilutibacter chinensis]|uniref:GNAT family N-acetyltransferase n=1 Tax=Marilutibacter chinensis TaxID=2912247 RepID=A0ABS9HYE1_9GAMM|nr:GNAT family protein [Lysobacter chinensis]MCF7223383.1 GNAT family N-acetyltransferase [Lysobacter chinensis]
MVVARQREQQAGADRFATTLPGEGFALRAWRMDDLESLVRHADDEQVSRAVSDRFPYPYTRADGLRFLSGEVVDLSQPVFAIEVDGEACGGIGVRPGVDERACAAELGYWLGRAYWGRGLMSRVVAAYAPWVMQRLSLHRLFATVQDDNPASAAVLLKNRFVEEGTLRCAVIKRGRLHDLRMFARTRDGLDCMR